MAWVTVNYDPLLEDALTAHYGADFGPGGRLDPALNTYISNPDWCLVHLHGSTRWARLTSIPRGGLGRHDVARAVVAAWDPDSDRPAASTVYQRAAGFGGMETRNELLLGRDAPVVGVPALTAPLAAKSSFECPPSHVEHLRVALAQADLLLTIGWRAREPHLLTMLSGVLGNAPDIVAVSQSSESAQRVCDSLRAALDVRPPSPVRLVASEAQGFSGLRMLSDMQFRTRLDGLTTESGMRRQARWLEGRRR